MFMTTYTSTRRAFVTNPTGFLREKLGDNNIIPLDKLFIETEEFSARITGIDVWRQPVLPYLKPQPNSWVPESFGLKIGDEYLEVSPQELPEIEREVETAITAGKASLKFKNKDVPASEQTAQAVKDLINLQQAIDDYPGVGGSMSTEASPPKILAEKRFLTVKTNFDDINFGLFDDTRKPSIPLPTQQPNGLISQLMEHQLAGFQWLVEACLWKYPGVLLADDMGLGKTLQTLSFLAWQQTHNPAPTLIVAPTGLLTNWKAEINRHLQPGALGTLVDAHGKHLAAFRHYQTHAADIQVGQSSLNVEQWKTAGVILTTYETMRDYHISFARLRFSCIVFDEIQKLKNPVSQISRSAQTLNAEFKIGLTGTPVENRLMDIWSIMDVLWPGHLGSSKDFNSAYPSHDADKLRTLHARLFQRINDKPALGLRRMKADHLNGLPIKAEHDLEVDMPPAQAEAYQNVVVRAHAARAAYSPGDGMLRTLHALRSTSLHPRAPETGYGDMRSYIQDSARLSKTVELLDTIKARQEKALIFIESLEMQAFMADFIQHNYALPDKPKRIHGQVTGAKRQQIVDEFQNRGIGFAVLILSPKAGGIGLTLTAANHVIHLSRWWNPAVEDQSTDRVFRIGQQKQVEVYYPMAVHPSSALRAHSFDLKLNSLLRRKRQLSTDTLIPPEDRDSDAASLFREVTLDPDAPASPPAAQPEAAGNPLTTGSAALPPETATTVPNRAVKSQSVARPTPETRPEPAPPEVPTQSRETPPAATPQPMRFHYPEHEKPNYDELFQVFTDARIEQVELLDPYSFWRKRGQHGLANVLEGLAGKGRHISKVRVVMYPSRMVKDRDFDTEHEGLRQLAELVRQRFSRLGKIPPQLEHKIRPKSRYRDFHDRFIHVTTKEGTIRTRRSYLVARGLDAFADYRMDLRIFIDEEQQL